MSSDEMIENVSHIGSVMIIRVQHADLINYSYVIAGKSTKYCLLIDPSWEPQKILAAIETQGLEVADILLTHAHRDHYYSLDFFIDKFNPRVWISDIESKYYHFDAKNLRTFFHEQKILWEKYTIETLLTPGHTKGSTCFLIENNLFTGDTLFMEGCGICDGKGGSAEDMFSSLEMLKSKVGNETQVFPGHSFGQPPGGLFKQVRADNIYLNFDDREMFVEFRERKNQKTDFVYY